MSRRSINSVEHMISALLHIHPRFMRSIHLERDIRDSHSSLGYILTPVAEQALERITTSFLPNSTQRAWRLTGDYGSGKTDFGLVLARVAIGAGDELPKELNRRTSHHRFLPMMATGDSEPLGVTVLRALNHTAELRYEHQSTEEVLMIVRDAVTQAKRNNYDGLLLILDELGKNLEYISRNPDSDDIFLLQRLAEEAARSSDNPFVIVVMLHQGVSAYAVGLGAAERREWDKVAGRFEEIVYAQPVEQVAALVAATLNVDTDQLPYEIRRESEMSMVTAIESGLYGASTGLPAKNIGSRIFPLHPTVLPVLVRAMRRFGQNERSLFSFISSAEPMGLQHYSSRTPSLAGHYRIHHLFDYVKSTLLPFMASSSASSHWGIIDTVLASTKVHNWEEEAVLKTIAMFNLLDAPDLPATENNIRLAVGGDDALVERAVSDLKNRGVIYERGSVNALSLWPHTSVNLDEVFEEALEITASYRDQIELLCNHIKSEPLVPRAYYVKTGTLRFANVQLIPANHLHGLLADQPVLDGVGSDLNIRIVLPLTKVQQREIERLLLCEASTLRDGLIVAVAKPPTHAITALRDLVAWEWVKKNTPQLSGDSFARAEVARQIRNSEKNLRARLGGLDNLAVPNASPLFWFSNSVSKRLNPGRQLLNFLGEVCSRIYTKSPRVLNELINRKKPSAAAVAARTKIAEAMATSPHMENLGMDDSKRPAEMALYLSVFRNGGFHVPDNQENGWIFRLPSREKDKCRLLPSITEITRLLEESGYDAMVPVTEIFRSLAKPPFGVREGLRPIILALYLATLHQRVALYEDGTYLPSVGGDEFHRLMKEPQAFHLQYCALEGVRKEVFHKLLAFLKYQPQDPDAADLLDLVRPLAVFIAQTVPDYARRTNRLPVQAVAVRRVLLESREPVRMVFTQLPEACGIKPVGTGTGTDVLDPDELAARLKKAMHDIQIAYPDLLIRIGDSLCAAFGITQGMPHGREVISIRAAQLIPLVTEPTLKAFALRLADKKLDQTAWLESVGNFLARKSPERWGDIDETEFLHQLENTAGRFKRTEYVLIGTTGKLNGHACRIALTRSDGSEVCDLVDWNGLDKSRLKDARDEIDRILDRLGSHGLAAAMEALWHRLDKCQLNKDEANAICEKWKRDKSDGLA